ncbi:MAG: trypsin-like peptidase domain-containing protein [bacterium]
MNKLLLLFVSAAFMGAAAFALTPQEEPVVLVVQKVKPAVVNIYTERMVDHAAYDPLDDFYERFFGGSLARGNRIVRTPARNLGSGLLVSSDGYIITNYHVVERANDLKIKVTLSDGADYEAALVRSDPYLDLSLVKITRPEPLPFFDLNKLSPNLPGQTVIVIGNPIGYESSVSQGILSAKDRTLIIDGAPMEGLLQTDAAINPGNSGGPLVDINGNLVGLSTAKMATARNIMVENIGFAVPAERVKAFFENSTAVAAHGGEKALPAKEDFSGVLATRLGIHVQELTPDLARAFGYNTNDGLLVSDVDPDSPADKAGIEKGMLVVGIEAYRIHSKEDLPQNLAQMKAGDMVRMTLVVLITKNNFFIQRAATVNLVSR